MSFRMYVYSIRWGYRIKYNQVLLGKVIRSVSTWKMWYIIGVGPPVLTMCYKNIVKPFIPSQGTYRRGALWYVSHLEEFFVRTFLSLFVYLVFHLLHVFSLLFPRRYSLFILELLHLCLAILLYIAMWYVTYSMCVLFFTFHVKKREKSVHNLCLFVNMCFCYMGWYV